MSLAQQQQLLAQLYTNPSLRERFLVAPCEVSLEKGLSETESQQFAAIVPHELQSFAESLFYKRLREVEKLLPLTSKILGAQFRELFRCFSSEFAAATIKKHFSDALAFAAFLQKNNRISPWITDLVGFESTKLEFNGGDVFFVFRIFQHDIREIIRIIDRHNHRDGINKLLGLQKRRTLAVWLRKSKNGQANYFVW